MNNKGYTFFEVIILLALAGFLFYSAIYIPTSLLDKHTEYTMETIKVNDVILLRTAVAEDLNNGNIKKVDDNTLMIGKSKYVFGKSVERENSDNYISLTNSAYSFELEKNKLKIYNDNMSLEYTVNSSFNKGGDGIE